MHIYILKAYIFMYFMLNLNKTSSKIEYGHTDTDKISTIKKKMKL